MKKYLLVLAIVLGINLPASAQLTNGSTAPDFTLTDRDGVTHNLYSYLNQGKVVFLHFFGCHCPNCWSHHTAGEIQDLYQTYGPSGTDQIVVLMIEYDQNNPEAFSGGGTYTQGDWETGNIIPMIDVEDPVEREIFTAYNLQYFHLLKVCSDKTVKLMNGAASSATLFQEADACAGSLSVGDNKENVSAFYNTNNKEIVLKGFKAISSLKLFNLMGQEVLSSTSNPNGTVDLSSFEKGMYLLRLEHQEGTFTKKILVQ